MNIIFFGSSDESIQLLDEISKNPSAQRSIINLFLKFKKKKIYQSKLFEYTNKNNILFLDPLKLDVSFVEKIHSLEP